MLFQELMCRSIVGGMYAVSSPWASRRHMGASSSSSHRINTRISSAVVDAVVGDRILLPGDASVGGDMMLEERRQQQPIRPRSRKKTPQRRMQMTHMQFAKQLE